MTLAFKLYEQVNEAPDDRTRFRLIVDAIRELEEGWPRPGEIARGADVREAELRLQKEIEGVRKEGEIVRKEIKEVELKLQKEIAQVRVDLEQVRVDLKSTEANLRTAMHRQTVWIIGAIGAVTGLVKLLDWLLA
jgi:hypothetical protein